MSLDFDKYKNTLHYPSRDEFKTVYVYKKGKLVTKKPATEVTTEDKAAWKDMVIENDFDEAGYRAAQTAYNHETSRLNELFKADALEYHGLTGHPKADKAYRLAWENGHSSGYQEVFNHLYDYADLLVG